MSAVVHIVDFKTSGGGRLDDTSKEVLPALGMCVIGGVFTETDCIGACDPSPFVPFNAIIVMAVRDRDSRCFCSLIAALSSRVRCFITPCGV